MSLEKENSGIRKEFKPVYVDSVQEGASDKHLIAILKQQVITSYPSSKAGNDKVSALFGANSFGAGKTFGDKPGDKHRSTLIKVPLADENGTSMTKEMVGAQLTALETTPRLYRVLSNDVRDCITSDQMAMIVNGRSGLTIEDYKESRMIKNGQTKEPILDPNGQVQYGVTWFSDKEKEDEDHRVSEHVRVQMNEETGHVDSITETTNVFSNPETAEM